MSKIKNRIGTLSTGVKVLSYAQTINGEAHWNCECPICHKIWVVKGSHLNEPKPIAACKKCSSIKNLTKITEPFSKDLTGQRFGKLVALERLERKNNSKTYFWKCKCDCGRYCEKEAQYLINGDTKSCGCIRSIGENTIAKMLDSVNIPYEREKILFDKLRFDFFIKKDYNNYVIEFDGIQHFQERVNREPLEVIHKRDLLKNKYCFNNNIPIIRIPYCADFTLKDLLLDTSNFILTKENESEYYRVNK